MLTALRLTAEELFFNLAPCCPSFGDVYTEGKIQDTMGLISIITSPDSSNKYNFEASAVLRPGIAWFMNEEQNLGSRVASSYEKGNVKFLGNGNFIYAGFSSHISWWFRRALQTCFFSNENRNIGQSHFSSFIFSF